MLITAPYESMNIEDDAYEKRALLNKPCCSLPFYGWAIHRHAAGIGASLCFSAIFLGLGITSKSYSEVAIGCISAFSCLICTASLIQTVWQCVRYQAADSLPTSKLLG